VDQVGQMELPHSPQADDANPQSLSIRQRVCHHQDSKTRRNTNAIG
jgi:hypothetical protein